MWGLTAKAGLPPTTLSGQSQTIKPTTFTFKTPNNQSTQTSGIESLIETGNTNILSNPSFEHSTFSTSWTNSAGTFTQETSVLISGKASAKLVLAAQTMSLTQSSTLYAAQFSDGVQGLAMVRVKSDIALSVCSIQAGTVSTTNCVTTNTDSKWGLYRVPFILGGTSNGISIASSGSVSGTVYLDDSFVGAAAIIQDVDQSRIAGESYFAGTTNCLWSRTSTSMGAFTADADCPGPTVNYSSMGTWATTDADLPRQTITNLPAGVYKATFYAASYQTTGGNPALAINDGTTTCEGTPAMGTVGTQSTTSVTCTFTYTSSGTRTFELYGGSSANTINVWGGQATPRGSTKFQLEYFGSGQTYSSQCGANCVDTFSAKISSADVVSNENVEFINGNCTDATAGQSTCNFNAGIFTTAPNCVATWQSATSGGRSVQVQSISSTLVLINITVSSTGAAANEAFNLVCQKQGADFVATRTIQGSFNEVVTSPGISKPKVCHYAFGGAAATLASPTECTTGTCVEVYDSCGTGTPPSWGTTALYSAITWASGTWANSSYIECRCTGFDVTTGVPRECLPSFITAQNSWSTNSNGGYVTSVYGDNGGGAQATMYTQMTCTGSAP